MTAFATNQDIQKSYLSIEYLPGDEEPIHNDFVWQTLCKVARIEGIRVYVKPLGDQHSKWEAPALIINEQVPNWYKPVLLAQKIIQWAVLGSVVNLVINRELSKDKADYIRKQSKLLYLEVQKALGATPEELEQIEPFVYGAAYNELVVEKECSVDAVELFGGGV